MHRVDQFSEWKGMPEDKKVKFISLKLKGHVLVWWKQVQSNRANKGKDKIMTCDRMKANLQ